MRGIGAVATANADTPLTRPTDADYRALSSALVASALVSLLGLRSPVRRWFVALLLITALALAIRIGYVLGWKNPATPQGDAFYYHYGANLFADGKGFPDPYEWKLNGHLVPKAQHPPLYIVVLGIGSFFGLRSYLDHQIISCVLGAASVLVVGIAGRRIISARAGLVAAVIAAVYPEFWLNDALVLSETLSILVTALVLLLAYRLWERPTVGNALWLGAMVALAALTRAELLLLTALLILPLIILMRALPWRRRLALLAASAAASVALLIPWMAYNAARFEKSALLGTSLGPTLLVANCPSTWSGPFKGWWDYKCIVTTKVPPGDASQQDAAYRRIALDFVNEHTNEIPGEVFARVGRVWGFYRPLQQLTFDQIETRELPASQVGLGMYYALVAGSVVGVVVLRRRRVPIIPLLAPVVAVTISAAAFYGTTRFRAAAEPSLVLLAVAAIDTGLGGVSRRLATHPVGRRSAP
jgi:4-amino-4-deoxy-L-arabinose transferase-like glycosyltransferase